MTRCSMKEIVGIVVLLTLAMMLSTCSASSPTSAGTSEARISDRTREQNAELGRQHKTAEDLFKALREEAKGGQSLSPDGLPDWSGVYSRPADKGFTFDPDQPAGGLPTAKLTPEYQQKMLKRIEDVKHGIEWDPISTCSPPGVPR